MIHRWIEYGDVTSSVPEENRLQNARVFWINGPGSAGTGKSTIAYTVAKHLDEHQKLGASFFCSRAAAECRNPKLIFPTIAYQLGQFYAPFQEQISAVLKADPKVAYLDIPYQLEKLVVKPLLAVKAGMPFCVVVIDALDECQDGGATSTILSSLAQYITALSPVKFLITSRPEVSIVHAFELAGLSQNTQRYILHHVEEKVVETDLLLYLHSSLQKTKKLYSLDDAWPSAKDLKALAELSSGLFIFAATATKFIEDRGFHNPQRQLAQLLNTMTTTDLAPYRQIDQLYLQILEDAFPRISLESAGKLKVLLGSLILLCNPLSSSNLKQLLGLTSPVEFTLHHLQSVIILPNDANGVIHVIHPSFHDFLTDPRRCPDVKFLITPGLQHSFLAEACLRALMHLKRDICNIRQPWKLHQQVHNLADLVYQHIPPFLQYACNHWSQHLSQSWLSDKLLDLLLEFCNNCLLFWVEVCSLLDDLQGASNALGKTHHMLLVC